MPRIHDPIRRPGTAGKHDRGRRVESTPYWSETLEENSTPNVRTHMKDDKSNLPHAVSPKRTKGMDKMNDSDGVIKRTPQSSVLSGCSLETNTVTAEKLRPSRSIQGSSRRRRKRPPRYDASSDAAINFYMETDNLPHDLKPSPMKKHDDYKLDAFSKSDNIKCLKKINDSKSFDASATISEPFQKASISAATPAEQKTCPSPQTPSRRKPSVFECVESIPPGQSPIDKMDDSKLSFDTNTTINKTSMTSAVTPAENKTCTSSKTMSIKHSLVECVESVPLDQSPVVHFKQRKAQHLHPSRTSITPPVQSPQFKTSLHQEMNHQELSPPSLSRVNYLSRAVHNLAQQWGTIQSILPGFQSSLIDISNVAASFHETESATKKKVASNKKQQTGLVDVSDVEGSDCQQWHIQSRENFGTDPVASERNEKTMNGTESGGKLQSSSMAQIQAVETQQNSKLLRARDKEIYDLKGSIKEEKDQVALLKKRLDDAKQALLDKEARIDFLENERKDDSKLQICQHCSKSYGKGDPNAQSGRLYLDDDDLVDELKQLLNQKDSEISMLKDMMAATGKNYSSRISELVDSLKNKDTEISKLELQNEQLRSALHVAARENKLDSSDEFSAKQSPQNTLLSQDGRHKTLSDPSRKLKNDEVTSRIGWDTESSDDDDDANQKEMIKPKETKSNARRGRSDAKKTGTSPGKDRVGRDDRTSNGDFVVKSSGKKFSKRKLDAEDSLATARCAKIQRSETNRRNVPSSQPSSSEETSNGSKKPSPRRQSPRFSTRLKKLSFLVPSYDSLAESRFSRKKSIVFDSP